MKILLFGCNGQVGWELQRALAHVRESRDSVPDADAIARARWPHSPRRMV